jgi:hypothetical protein
MEGVAYKCSDLLLAVYYFIHTLRSKTNDELILHPYFSMHQCIFQQETGMGNVVHSPCRYVDERSGSMLHFVHDPEKVEIACNDFFDIIYSVIVTPYCPRQNAKP